MDGRKIVLCVVIFIFCVGLHVSNATMCKPLSKFKIDCNTCFCSRDGARYACTRKACRGEPFDFQFINDEGYNDNILTNNKNEKEVRIPFINDEIPPSKEEWDDDDDRQIDDEYLVPLRNEIDEPRFDKPIQDVDIDDQEVEDLNDYRFKREFFV